MLSDIEIAQASKMKDIVDIAADLGIEATELENYGRFKAKVSDSVMNRLKDKKNGRLILVTAINPTPAGEGKTTTTVGLGQALNKVGKKAIIALREPSLGPVFGVKGGAAGGGYSQVVPMEDINLHFTGDMHAITTANNLLSCAIDNHIHQGNDLKIDLRRLTWKRVLDMNDRALRDVVISLGGKPNGFPREDGFMITVASEIMAILCLSNDISDLKARLGKIFIGYSLDNKPIYCKDLQVDGAMAALLKDAIKPNLVQTLENTPAFVHGGPFANIAHGCNSVRATKLALKLADYCVTEAGFGSDLGAEKFFDIKCRAAGLTPDAVVVVATARALKYNAGVSKADAGKPNAEALKKGLVNLEAHIDNMKNFGVPTIIAVNVFAADTQEELDLIADCCKRNGAEFSISNVFAKGGEGGIDLANKVIETIENKPTKYAPLYDLKLPLKDKMSAIATKVYGADGVVYSADAEKKIAEAESLGLGELPICVAKTQYSLTDDQTKLGRPKGFEITVKDIRFSVGAGFVVFLTGDIMTMPGLPKVPAANKIDIDADGVITGLF